MISFWLKTFTSNSLQLGIKLHPNCPQKEKSYIDQTLSKFSNNYFYVEPNLSIEDAIISSKVLLAQHSTTLLEAFFLKKPSICLDPTNIRKNMSYTFIILNFFSLNGYSIGQLIPQPIYSFFPNNF